MGKLDVSLLRHLLPEHFRLLTAIEMGMKNHELVPMELVASIARCQRIGVAKMIRFLCESRLVAYERGKKYDGYRLTNMGYDYLALNALCKRGTLSAVGNQIGVGKESDVYIGENCDGARVVLKFHKLGRTSFRAVKTKRDYHKKRTACSWLYLSRLAALKEHAFLKALFERDFPVPEPIDYNRHLVCMSLVPGFPLCRIAEISDPAYLYDSLMSIIVKLAECGLVHGDLNQFNVMITQPELDLNQETNAETEENDDQVVMPDSEYSVVLIDFPQMISTDHSEAETQFDRDVQCIRDFIRRRFDYESELYPKLEDICKETSLDSELEASGYTPQVQRDIQEATSNDHDALNDQSDHAEGGSCSEESDATIGDEADATPESTEPKVRDVRETHLSLWLEKAVGSDMTKLTLAEGDRVDGDGGTQLENVCEGNNPDLNPTTTARASSTAWTHTSTVISQEEVRARARKQAKAHVHANKPKMRVKHGAVSRKRQDDKAVIKEYDGWDF